MPELSLDERALTMLRQARTAYRGQEGIEHYDEVLTEVTARAQGQVTSARPTSARCCSGSASARTRRG